MANVHSIKEAKKNDEKKGGKKSFLWVIGVVVLVLISITFILPQTGLFMGNSNNTNTFGKYNGEDIVASYDGYFNYAFSNAYYQYLNQYGEELLPYLQSSIYYTAYRSTVVNTAFKQLAKKAGMKVTDKEISDAIVSSGYYGDDENSFVQENYDKATETQRNQILGFMESIVPQRNVQGDITSAKMSSKEKDFITSLSSSTRAFDYYKIDEKMYKDEDLKLYAEENPTLFETLSFLRADYDSADEATTALTEIGLGNVVFEDEATPFTLPRHSIEKDEVNASSDLFSSTTSTLLGPYEKDGKYSLYKVTSESESADLSDETTLEDIRSYIVANESDSLKSYLESLSREVFASAEEDFDAIEDKYSIEKKNVGSVAKNRGNSAFILSFSTVDTQGDLTSADKEESYDDLLFSSPLGTVLEPVYANGGYIITKIKEGEGNETYPTNFLSSYYSTYAPEYTIQDFGNEILSSPKHKDNFQETYSKLVSSSNS